MKIEVLRLRNPAALEIPELVELFDAAFANVTNRTAKKIMKESVADEDTGIFLARIGTEWKGMAWVRNSTRADDKSALVLHFFCRKAGRGVREALVKAVVDFAKEGGMTTLTAWDMNRKARAFQRIFKSAGPSKEIIRAYEFDLSQAKE